MIIATRATQSFILAACSLLGGRTHRVLIVKEKHDCLVALALGEVGDP